MPRIIKVKNPMGLIAPVDVPQTVPQTVPVKRSIKIKKGVPVPPPPAAGIYVTKAMDAQCHVVLTHTRVSSIPVSSIPVGAKKTLV